jgi:predicted ATPase/signal transduction histidine kinase/tRNA A-37 threonylcarbamoyl transferase component Bud32
MEVNHSEFEDGEILPGYRVRQCIYQSANSMVYRAVHLKNHKPVILKVLRPDYASPVELSRYTREYEILRRLDLPGVIRVYGLEPYRNTLVLIGEDFGGLSIREWLEDRARAGSAALHPAQFLDLSLKIADAIDQIHMAGVIHKNIHPGNIVYNPLTGALKLIDFGLAATLSRDVPAIPQVLEGHLAYLSPERTGRMNRAVDYRTDLYSLGVTLYELLTARLPFEADDALELVHYHLAKMPVSPSVQNPSIPAALSEIVLKLLAKAPEDRYQSARGLKYDLDVCLQQWQAHGEISTFALGEQDRANQFLIPEKLYGREEEVQILLAAFERVTHGQNELMMISGHSGIGKTAMISEIHQPVVRHHGYLIQGKYDAFSRNIPYSAFVQAFRDLMTQIASENEAARQRWHTKILAALGQNGQVILDVIPELERIIGPQMPAPELAGTAAQNRFNFLFQKFIACFTAPEHPLVIFLDDLQWADWASLKLIRLLVQEAQAGYLMLLGTFREQEAPASHPLRRMLADLQKSGTTLRSFSLGPLKLEDINQMIADTLNCPPDIALPLTRLVYQKTQGNPFFTRQFLKALYVDGLITFNTQVGYWQCDLARINLLAVSDDVVAFMAGQLQKLPPETQEALKLAAYIGSSFHLKTLALVSQHQQEDTAADLRAALQEGFVLPQREIYPLWQENGHVRPADPFQRADLLPEYRFVHDRVQQAAYSLTAREDGLARHLQIGRVMLENTPDQELDEKLFEICEHLNAGSALMDDPDEREALAKLNLRTGRKAKTAAAYPEASRYLRTGLQLLPEPVWETHYELTLALHNELAEVAYLAGDFDQVEQMASAVFAHARCLLDEVKLHEVLIQTSIARYQFQVALQHGLTVLRAFGLTFPETPGPADIGTAFQEMQAVMAGRSAADLLDLPRMTDPPSLAAMRILSSMGAPAYLSCPPLFPLLILRQLILSIQNGNTADSIYAYTACGTTLCGVTGDIDGGYAFGQLALGLLEKLGAKEVLTRNYFQYYVFIHHWKHPIADTLPYLLEAYHVGLETGDLEFACYGIAHYLMNAYFTGQELNSLATEIALYRDAIHSHHQESPYNYSGTLLQAILNLRGRPERPNLLVGEAYDETRMLPVYLQTGEITALHNLFLHKLILSYLFEDYEQARQDARQSEQYLSGVPGIVAVVLHYYYDSLLKLAEASERDPQEQAALLEQVAQNMTRLQDWGAHAPANYQHKYELVKAEWERVLGHREAALEAYERAISLAAENGFLQEEALALELAARFFFAWGKDRIGRLYLTRAYEAYQSWGATAKVAQLEQRYPSYLGSSPPAQDRPTRGPVSSGLAAAANLDLATVIKASQAIAGEIELPRLLQRMIRIILENAGAQRCVLLLEENGAWVIQAEGHVDRQEPDVLQGLKLQDGQPLPIQLIHRVAKTHQNVVLDDAAADHAIADPYLQHHQVRSALCLPLINRGRLSGMLYLENNLIAQAFSAERVELLNLLSTQMAISLENARLYSNLEAAVAARTRQLQELNQELETFSYSVSHDLRGPLRSINGFSQALLEDYPDALDAEGQRFLVRIHQAANLMGLIIDSLLQLSRVTRREMKTETVDLSMIAEQILIHLHETQPERAVEWIVAPGIRVQGDSGLLHIVLDNLLNNAWKFTRNKAQARIVFDSLQRDGEFVYFVQDNGVGFNMAYTEKLFRAFERLHNPSDYEGTGIGLATVRRVIQRHGGRIWAESQEGQGATFFFTLST